MRNITALFLTLLLCSLSSNAQLKAISYQDGNQKLDGFAIQPKKKSNQKPGILILPAWKGIDDHSKQTAIELSNLGYHAFIADIYGEGNYPKDNAEAGKNAGYYKKNTDLYQKRISLALAQLIQSGANADNIAVIRVHASHFGFQIQDIRATFRNNYAGQRSRGAAFKRIRRNRYRRRTGKCGSTQINDLDFLGMGNRIART